MKLVTYNLENDYSKLSIEIETPSEQMILEKWGEFCEDLEGHKITPVLVDHIEKFMAEWVIDKISVTTDFGVK